MNVTIEVILFGIKFVCMTSAVSHEYYTLSLNANAEGGMET